MISRIPTRLHLKLTEFLPSLNEDNKLRLHLPALVSYPNLPKTSTLSFQNNILKLHTEICVAKHCLVGFCNQNKFTHSLDRITEDHYWP